MYLKKRIRLLRPQTFCEIGSGNGHLSHLLLKAGLAGIGYDLNGSACANNAIANKAFIEQGKYSVVNGDFLSSSEATRYDYIFSCMVIEHLDDATVARYFDFCKSHLKPGGRIAVLVPANMKFWGIEDETAGHYKRYAFADFQKIAASHQLSIQDLAGLTYPVSNLLLPFSNNIVSKHESHKQELSVQEKAISAGNRELKFKTDFPWYAGVVLNEVVMYPFYVLQRINRNNPDSMVIYCEMAVGA